jgi:hypothetical protein
MLLPVMMNAESGRIITTAVTGTLHLLPNPRETTAQVSAFTLGTRIIRLRPLGLSEMPNRSPEDTRIEVACGTENGSPAAWIEVERDGQVTFFNQNGDKSTCVLNDGYKVGSWCNATDLLTPTTSSSASLTATSPPFHTDGSVTPQPLLSCACPAV